MMFQCHAEHKDAENAAGYLTTVMYRAIMLAMGSKAPISNALRKAIRASGLTRYRISKESGVDQAALSRFMAGKTGLTSDTLDRLADILGLELRTRPEHAAGKKGQGNGKRHQ
ncbi:MAG: helix-turn-helix transcriptional regulator [Phycisphaerae bacterium]|nr:helix-turn-helix transcriptional regulator [Phycisphaerae bacterium]